MAHPKRRTSKSVKNMRRSHHALEAPAFSSCPSCGQSKASHRVCSHCGYYDKDRSISV
jgi:large subunit ribosomal protein L32